MGIFANAPNDASSTYIGPIDRKVPWHGQSGFEAVGHEVPLFRRSEAERHLKAMGFDSAEDRFSLINGMSDAIARDNVHEAMEVAYKKNLDVTGCYRLLAVLLTAEEPS
jgi:hypothetical protein